MALLPKASEGESHEPQIEGRAVESASPLVGEVFVVAADFNVGTCGAVAPAGMPARSVMSASRWYSMCHHTRAGTPASQIEVNWPSRCVALKMSVAPPDAPHPVRRDELRPAETGAHFG
ncbi:hypothetical protein [Streptomyces sp. NBC_01361]|uniref:hypothetical protein n=1 Tax=Streptomyces sp. NBC_01361 TaxID=2903838 RepID=UPI002E351749|nr:hypothetical protein [Streptomyces sp. NBC_01361]